jgi:lycopene cyclase domain-containing protein
VRASYALLLAACVAVTLPLELVFRARVYRRPRRWLLSLLPVVVAFGAWDVYAVARRHWRYDPAQTLGVAVANLPLEEVAFFVVVPTCALLTYEAVRRVLGDGE